MSYASYSSLGKDPAAPSPETMGDVVKISSGNHRRSLLAEHRVVVIDNYTDWCGPCKIVGPQFCQRAQKYQNSHRGQIIFAKENVDDHHDEAPKVTGVPCFHFYIDGKLRLDLTITGGDMNQLENNIELLLKT